MQELREHSGRAPASASAASLVDKTFPPATEGLSRSVLGIDWNAWFPCLLGETGIVAERTSYEHAMAFAREHFPRIYRYDETSPFLILSDSTARETYYRAIGDFFALRDAGSCAGIFIGTLSDWSTYYIRSTTVVPEYQGRKLCQAFLHRLLAALGDAGVERAEVEIAPANTRNLHVFTKLGFIASGFQISERWGSLVRYTRYLSPANQEVFLKQFCVGGTAPDIPAARKPNR